MGINGVIPISLQQSSLYQVAFYWILAGAILSFLSRFGGILTFTGLLAMGGEPYWSFGFVTIREGILLAIAGGILSFAGTKWTVPGAMLKGREMLGGLVYSVGFLIVLTQVIAWNSFDGFHALPIEGQLATQVPLFLVGLLLTGIGLRMFLSQKRENNSLKALSRPT